MCARPIKRPVTPREPRVKRRSSYAQVTMWIALLRNFPRVVVLGLHFLQALREYVFRNVVLGSANHRVARQNSKIGVKVGRNTHSDQDSFRLLWRAGHTRRMSIFVSIGTLKCLPARVDSWQGGVRNSYGRSARTARELAEIG